MITTATKTLTSLQFRPITSSDFGEIAHFMSLSDSRTCDYTFGGIVLWAKHFDYRVATAGNTLYVCGGREDDLSVRAFAMPVGDDGFSRSIRRLEDFAGRDLWLSAVPEDRLHLFASLPAAYVSELGPEWSDYLYDIRSFASLAGGAMKKKRNHVNRFMAENPDARLVDITPSVAPECLELLRRIGCDGSATGRSEFSAVAAMLADWGHYAPYFCGSALSVGGNIAGFTVGEPKGDTLHVHVEKCDHSLPGANEALASLFAAEMLRRVPRLEFANRQDDAGDPGLRASKQSWHPLRLLPKFNIHITSRG